MKIYLIRHGETDWNVQGRLQGREDIPMNENGILQAKQCGQALERVKFGAIISSPLSRAIRTAEIIAEHNGITKIIIEEDLTERDFFKLSGLTYKERDAFFATGQEAGIELKEVLYNRMMACIRKYAEIHQNEDNIAMISHGAAINAVLTKMSEDGKEFRNTILKNTCINVIDSQNGNFKVELYNLSPEEYINNSIDK